MSVKQMALVWEHEWAAGEQLVMLSLADHADHEGRSIWPSHDLTAYKTGYKRRNVQRVIKQLRDKEILVVEKESTATRPTEYRIDWSKAERKESWTQRNQPEQNETRDAKIAPQPPQGTNTHARIAPEPSGMHWSAPEPSKKERSSNEDPKKEKDFFSLLQRKEKEIVQSLTRLKQWNPSTQKTARMVQELTGEYPDAEGKAVVKDFIFAVQYGTKKVGNLPNTLRNYWKKQHQWSNGATDRKKNPYTNHGQEERFTL